MRERVLSLFKSNRSEQEPSNYYELEDTFDEELFENEDEDESEHEIDPGITSWHYIP